MTTLSGLLPLALVGTDRSEWPPVDGLPGAVVPVFNTLRKRPLHEALLLLVGSFNVYEDAGRLPPKAGSTDWHLPAFRPEGDRLPCPGPAARFLERMLNQKHTDLLPEFLTCLDQRQARVSDELLPHLLEYGAKTPRLRPLILPVIGERGYWLASLNPAWVYAAIDGADWRSLRFAWGEDKKGRAALATYLRRGQADTGRQLIETTWRDEDDATRRELIRAMGNGLSAADEPFLERALDDRDAQVRRQAVELLAMLPDSRLVGRITRAAGDWLTWQNDEVLPILPAGISDQLVRDGVQRPVNPVLTPNERSRLLLQTVGVIPPAHWEERFRIPPEEIVAAVLAGKWPRTLITAFSSAAGRHRDSRWAQALLTADRFNERTRAVLGLLAPETLADHIKSQLEAGNDMAMIVFLRHWPHPWDETSARQVIDFLARHAGAEPETRYAPTLRYLSRQFAHQCPPSLAGFAAERFRRIQAESSTVNRAWELSLSSLVTKVTYRQAMHHAFEETAA